jgi:ATPase subunit of ABC transporter with duplicated ATPase domains
MIFTSHDHQLTQTVANKIVDISNGKVVIRECTYDDYLEEITK